jgi:spermidine/putrescine transport system ATP-binding protein
MDKAGSIDLVNVSKSFENTQVLHTLNLHINAGEFVSLLGPSGCGKTTILRLIAGFIQPDGGEIRMDGKRLDKLPPYKRNVNTVFQNYALFPNLNVYENVAYGLRARRCRLSEIKEKVAEILEMVQLSDFKNRQIDRMSGGQRQRVAIARAVVNEPEALLLDEPLSALDLKLRKEMRYELRRLQKQLGITFVFVTHDQEEALVMSDHIVVMNEGRIEQVGTPDEIYDHPVSQFVADFIGESNTFEAVVSKKDDAGMMKLIAESGIATGKSDGFTENEMVNISIRPDKIQWSPEPSEGFEIEGRVKSYIFDGSFHKVLVKLINGDEIKITRLTDVKLPEVGKDIYLYWPPEDGVVMHAYSGSVVSYFESESGISKEIRKAREQAGQ